MYEFQLQDEYKSIKSVPELKLGDFVLLTGVNGSRKTHLLEAVDNGSVAVVGDDDGQVDSELIRLFTWNTLHAGTTATADATQLERQYHNLWKHREPRRDASDPSGTLSETLAFDRVGYRHRGSIG